MQSESGQLTKTFALEMLAKRLWAKVDVKGPNECWPWLRYTDFFGYGQIYDGRKYRAVPAHRIVWELMYGVIPDGICVCHHCDSPSCCNPEHLFLGTRADNSHDAMQKGRLYRPVGELCTRSKLTVEQVLEIRRRYSTGKVSQPRLATEFGVGKSAVNRAIRRETWKHI